MTARLVVLASGTGTNLQAIIDACENTQLDAQVVGVVSDKHEAFALNRAQCNNVETAVVAPKPHETRPQYDARLAQIVGAWQPHIVVLAGFMRVLSNSFLSQFPNQVINIHPALPGQLPGTHAIERAFTEFTHGTRNVTGVMIHFVHDEGVDNGPVIAQQVVPIHAADTLVTLEARMHATEHALVIDALQQLITQQKAPAS
ncbi:MAG: phosphoribosylglycinamide formyltransferase [Actinobacteria bacterium]|nr:MAG: phosphoribosylglycinamide formyltransferase [Actinomycetota bacterium]